MSNTNTTFKIDPLNGDNYTAWRRCLMVILDDLELWDIANGSEMKPILTGVNETQAVERQAIADWIKKDKKTRKEIFLCISDEHQVYIDDAMTGYEIWTRLQDIFESRGAVGVVNLRREFFRTFAEDGASMEEHVRKLRGLRQELSARGQSITDSDFANTLLTSLPDSWSTFITAVNAGGIAISSNTLISRILDEDWARQAGAARQTALKASERPGATKGTCHNCDKKGHYVADCWAKGGGKEGQVPKWFKTRDTDTTKQTEQSDFAFMANAASISMTDWLADTAASTHIARNKQDFITYSEGSSEIAGIVPGASLKTKGRGSVTLEFKVNEKVYSVVLRDVKHAPEAPNNLISVGRLTGNGHSALFTPVGVQFKERSGTIFGMGRKVGNMYQMRARVKKAGQKQDFIAVTHGRTWDKWHRILGHVNHWTIKILKTNNLVTGLDVDESQAPTQCTACVQSKQHVEPFPQQATKKAEQTGNLVVSDVWGPAQVEGPTHEKYFYSYTNAKSRYSAVYFGNTKDEVLKHFETFKAFLETQTGNKVKHLHSDNGGEYVNKLFKDFCAKNGVIMETTAPYSPAQNGIAE